MKIVILDGHALNPGDLSWDSFKELGDVDLYEETPPDQVVERAAYADALIINKIVIDREILSALPSLRYVGITATGYNIVDLEALRERRVALTNVPAYSTDGVAQAVFADLIAFLMQEFQQAPPAHRHLPAGIQDLGAYFFLLPARLAWN